MFSSEIFREYKDITIPIAMTEATDNLVESGLLMLGFDLVLTFGTLVYMLKESVFQLLSWEGREKVPRIERHQFGHPFIGQN